MSLDYSGFESMLQMFKSTQKDYSMFIKKFLTEMGMRAIAQTKKLTPVDTGELRNKWELSEVYRKGDSLYVVLFNPQIYASFVEDGHMQHKRFLPIKYLQQSKASQPYVNYLEEKYGDDISGVMLHEKWVPGHHMARISIAKIEQELPKRYEKAFDEFIKAHGF